MNAHRPRLLLILLTIICLAGCSSKNTPSRCLLPQEARLQAGDVVFRRGCGFTSHAVLFADRQGNYSHVGIVVDSCGTLLVVHAVPGEPDYEGDPDRVKADTPQHFFSTEYTSIGEVRRPADASVAAKAAQVAWQVYQRHTLFDHDYDDADTTRMYCTELVAFAFSRAGHDIVEGRRRHVNLPFIRHDCVFPSDVHASDFLTPIIIF